MCICSKNSDDEHLDETKIVLIVIFHVFIFRKWPNSFLQYLTYRMIIILSYSGATEQISTFHFSLDSKCVLYFAFTSSSNEKSVESNNVPMSNKNKMWRK